MSTRDLENALAQVNGIIRALEQYVTVYSVDTMVHSVKRVFNANAVELKGRGGTDMAEGIEVAARDGECDAIVVCTDCETPWPEEKPSVPVIVCAIGARYGLDGVPGWAKLVVVEES